ncbi:hypothetical protein DB347_24440 [Opitutaceae bacterium EW11]|nr:hypothetical protein DB347_24440 [Opitutaceae bacterium EW11]
MLHQPTLFGAGEQLLPVIVAEKPGYRAIEIWAINFEEPIELEMERAEDEPEAWVDEFFQPPMLVRWLYDVRHFLRRLTERPLVCRSGTIYSLSSLLPNKSLQPTSFSVTSRAGARAAPEKVVAEH